ncbi:MAG: tetratricopeptide repeat protein, partial [Flavobacterium sp.]|uniref:tetratricopeptide repeat-containing sensor histidine kinase n=1 Tax=Flavobacterium sp. TaxID=239 RepID=UPI00121D7719
MKQIILLSVALLSAMGFAQQKTLVDSIKTELQSASHDTVRIQKMFALVSEYSLSKPDSAFYYVDKITVLSNKIGYKKGQTNVLGARSSLHREIGNLAIALDLAFKAVALSKKNNLPQSELRAYNLLGIIYLDLNDHKRAISYYQKARKIAKRENDLSRIYLLNVNTAGAYVRLGMVDSAAFYLDIANKSPKFKESGQSQLSFYRNLGNLEVLRGNFEKALKLYDIALDISVKEGNYRNEAFTCNKIAATYELKKQTDSVILYADRAMGAAKKGPFRIMILEAAAILSKAYERKADYKQAYHIQKLKEKTQEELFGTNNIKSIQEAISREQKRADELRQNQIGYQTQLRQYAFIAGLAVLLVVALLLFKNNLQKQKSNKQLGEQKQKLEVTLEELKATQSQLIQSEKMASLGELTAGIAHEIQNPLNFVNNFSDVSNELVDEILDERRKTNDERDETLVDEILSDIKQNLEKISHHGKRADAIVKGMLQHSRSTSGEKEPTDINALADEYLRLAYHGLRAKDKSFNAELITNFAENLPKVKVIPQDIGRVLLNLITNAFYATQ